MEAQRVSARGTRVATGAGRERVREGHRGPCRRRRTRVHTQSPSLAARDPVWHQRPGHTRGCGPGVSQGPAGSPGAPCARRKTGTAPRPEACTGDKGGPSRREALARELDPGPRTHRETRATGTRGGLRAAAVQPGAADTVARPSVRGARVSWRGGSPTGAPQPPSVPGGGSGEVGALRGALASPRGGGRKTLGRKGPLAHLWEVEPGSADGARALGRTCGGRAEFPAPSRALAPGPAPRDLTSVCLFPSPTAHLASLLGPPRFLQPSSSPPPLWAAVCPKVSPGLPVCVQPLTCPHPSHGLTLGSDPQPPPSCPHSSVFLCPAPSAVKPASGSAWFSRSLPRATLPHLPLGAPPLLPGTCCPPPPPRP